MAIGTHASGFIGIAFETTYGTYAAPTRYFPIKSESLTEVFNNSKRRLIRGIADNLGHVKGYRSVEGDIAMELMEDVLPYFLYVSRNTIVKGGTDPDFTYTTTPAHVGNSTSLTKPSLSITVVRNGQVFGFVGCVVSQMEFTVEEAVPTVTFSIIGSSEAAQTTPVPVWAPTTDIPFSAGMYSIQVPTATDIFTVENFTLTINDNAEPQYRLGTNLGAAWVKFGQREVMLQMDMDFDTRAEFDLFKAMTGTTVTIEMTRTADRSVTFLLSNAVRDVYEIDGLSDQGAATMAHVTFEGDYDPSTAKSYEIIVASNADIS